MAIKTFEDGFKDGVDHAWSIIRFHQKQIFREIARCEHYEHYTQSSEYKAMASLLGNIMKEIDEKRFIEEFDLDDSENRYDDIDNPLFDDGGDNYTSVENDEDVEFLEEDIDCYKMSMQYKGRS